MAGMVFATHLNQRGSKGGGAAGHPPKNRHCLLFVSSEMERTALNLSLPPQTLAKPREGIFASHLTPYICVVLVVALASYGYWLKTRSIFACQAPGYSADRYLAYCGGGNYADYEHGAFAF